MRERHILIGLFVPFNNRTIGEPKILMEGRVEGFSNTWFHQYGFGQFRKFMGCHARMVQVLVG